MATTLDWVKSLRADIRGDCLKGWNLSGREFSGKMVIQMIEMMKMAEVLS